MSELLNEIMCDAINKQKGCLEDYERVYEMIDLVMSLADTARKEGLLALEERITFIGLSGSENSEDSAVKFGGYHYFYIDRTGVERFLVMGVTSACDGTFPEKLEQILCNKYLVNDYQGRDALIACMLIRGVLDVQAGEYTHTILQNFLSLIPDDAEKEYLRRKYEKETREMREREAETEKFKQEENEYCKGFCDIATEDISGEGPLVDDWYINDLILFDGRSIQKVIRAADDNDIYLAWYAMTPDTRHAIFENRTIRCNLALRERIINSERPDREDIIEGSRNVLMAAKGLVNGGDIIVSRGTERMTDFVDQFITQMESSPLIPPD